nr:PREDICTED: RLA class I histocompatibility antigen, alpha chain 11/11-like [Lepisosteus oculatus]
MSLTPFAPPLSESASASHWLVYSSTAVSEAGLLSQLLISRVLDQQTVSHWDSASRRETRTRHWPSGAAGLRDINYEHEETENRERLQGILRKRSNMGKVSPQVFVSSKRREDTQNCSLSCLVTGFSPGVIEVSLSRAGETEGDEVWSSGLRPNGDATHQLRKSVEIRKSEIELYNCTVSHHSSNYSVTLSWGLCSAGDGTSQWHKIALASGITVLAACLLSMIGYSLNKRTQQL